MSFTKMDEFDMLYDDWMTFKKVEIEKNYVAKDMAMIAEIKYSCHINDENFEHMYDKALATHQKLAMMQFAKSKLEEVILDFESTQNMDVPAYVYGDLLFGTRVDGFNKLIKKVKTSDDSLFFELIKKHLHLACFVEKKEEEH